ncbi:MAG: hypothetical protein ABI835_22125 [Chloroflexota bacterium]
MSLPGLVFALLLTAFVLMWIGLPLMQRGAVSRDDPLLEKQRERLLLYYERVLRNIHDLDEDHTLGKIDATDYARDREEWAQRGAQVLQALDTLPTREVIALTPADDSAVDSAIDDAIETAVARYRQRKPQ